MGRQNDGVQLDGLACDESLKIPLHRQLYQQLREMIHSGVLAGGSRVPSSRVLCTRLGVSRFTIVTALDQLTAEGYLRTVSGSGTFVESIPELLLQSPRPRAHAHQPAFDSSHLLSDKAKNLEEKQPLVATVGPRYLHMSAPDHRLFPVDVWSKLTREVLQGLNTELACYRSGKESSLLEQQIAIHVALNRGVTCDPEEVVVTSGAHHAVSLLAELLLDPGDSIAFEEPGMPAVRSIFKYHGCVIHPMRVDELGADPSTVKNVPVKLAFVTAAKQQPLTVSMPVRRKTQLLNWAAKNKALIIEDDLGSEYRYEGQPIPPLKAMDSEGQVIYISAFSMSLFQSLRVGFMIMPRTLARHCRNLIRVRYRATHQVTEQVLARFIQDGHYSRYIHKTRRIYENRQRHLLKILREDFSEFFLTMNLTAGFYILCYFRDQSMDENEVLSQCSAEGLDIEQLSYYYPNKRPPKKGLLVGFAMNSENEITLGLKTLRSVLLEKTLSHSEQTAVSAQSSVSNK